MIYKKDNSTNFDLREIPQEEAKKLIETVLNHFADNKITLVIKRNKTAKKSSPLSIKYLNDQIK